jgi:hypothetical protein
MRFLITLFCVAGDHYGAELYLFGILFLILLFPISSWCILVAVVISGEEGVGSLKNLLLLLAPDF